MTDRFDLEQQIMTCWSVVDDIKALNEYQQSGSLTDEQMKDYLKGLETIYQIKFERLFDIFEQCVRRDVFKKPSE